VEQTIARRTAWGGCTILCLLVGLYALRFVAVGFADVPDEVASNHFLSPGGLRLHIAVTAVAIIVAPWQFARRLRDRHPLVHRTMGRIYLVTGFIGIGTGTAIALGSSQGLVAGTGFLCLGLAWLTVTAIAYRMILARDLDAHRRWMLRSFALIFGAVTLRIYLPVSFALGLEFESSYPVIAWVNWVPNIVLMEWWIRREARRRTSLRVANDGQDVDGGSGQSLVAEHLGPGEYLVRGQHADAELPPGLGVADQRGRHA
jgi:hypothetical protein